MTTSGNEHISTLVHMFFRLTQTLALACLLAVITTSTAAVADVHCVCLISPNFDRFKGAVRYRIRFCDARGRNCGGWAKFITRRVSQQYRVESICQTWGSLSPIATLFFQPVALSNFFDKSEKKEMLATESFASRGDKTPNCGCIRRAVYHFTFSGKTLTLKPGIGTAVTPKCTWR